jgi:hypothetical protein
MDRGLIVGAIAFVAAFGAERLYVSLAKDIARYEAMRRMSGQPPILKEVLSSVFGNVMESDAATGMAKGLVSEITNDVMRYARMKSM